MIGDDTSRSLREINAAAAQRHFEACTAKVLAEPDQERAASLKRSANSRWAQAKSIFTPRCLEYYRGKDLHHECLEEFLRAGELSKFNRIPKTLYHPPADKIIQDTLSAWEAITDRNLFLAIGHELSFGLRIGELAQATWGWHQVRCGYPVLDSAAHVKNNTGWIQVRALDPWYSTMQLQIDLNGWRGEPEDLIITGTATYRKDGLFRAVSDFLRRFGWETMKTNHALRAYAGSQIAMRYGIYEAQVWLRHSTVKVTEQNYSHFIQKFKPADVNTIAARWAICPVPAKVTSGIPDVTLDETLTFQQAPPDSAKQLRITALPVDFNRTKN